MTDEGFVKAQSDNLPAVDVCMVMEFLRKSEAFVGPEMRGVKAARSAREEYGDNAVGYVQTKRDGSLCMVKCRITPEHKVKKKGYSVFCHVNEEEMLIDSASCEDCTAASGGCKHVVAFLFWLHRRSEEPSKTDVECYWKRSKLAGVGSSTKFICLEDMGGLPQTRRDAEKEERFFKLFLEKTAGESVQLTRSLTSRQSISMHHMLVDFKGKGGKRNADDFFKFCSNMMSLDKCKEVLEQTTLQSKCKLWSEMRYGRVTASKLHEAAHCKTVSGSLVNSVLGAANVRETMAMARGRNLEPLVLKAVEKEYRFKVRKCGLYLSGEFPSLGASPDGITDSYVVEVKCPASLKNKSAYTENGDGEVPSRKFLAQVHLQMLLTGKKEALFCVADHDFEKSGSVTIMEVSYSRDFCHNLLNKARKLWINHVFPVMYDSL